MDVVPQTRLPRVQGVVTQREWWAFLPQSGKLCQPIPVVGESHTPQHGPGGEGQSTPLHMEQG
jgi:hypothetical protein